MITGNQKDPENSIGYILGTIGEKYSEAATGTELDAMDDEQMKNSVISHSFYRSLPQSKIHLLRILNIR